MRFTSRFEYKYIITHKQYYALKNLLYPYVEPDEYTKKGDDGKYFVSSIYYDTHDLKAYHERNDGQYGRIKLRIRTYDTTPCDNSYVSVELKTKNGNSMIKYSSLIPINKYYYYVASNNWDIENNAVLNEFLRLQKIRSLSPQIIVQYKREGYIPKERGNLRITFDHNVSSAKSNYLFTQNSIFKPHRPKNIILEIKCHGEQPKWLKDIVKKQELKIITNSKYVQGIEVVRPLMVTPRVELIKH